MSHLDRGVDESLDDAPCGYLSFTDSGTLRTVNRTLLDMLGYSAGELHDQRIEAILSVGSRVFYHTHFFPLLRLTGRADELFLQLRAKDGGDIAVMANAVRRARGAEWVTTCVCLQLVERRKFEDALLAAKQVAEEARLRADAQRREIEATNELLERQAVELEMSQQRLVDQAEELERQRVIAEEANRAKSAFVTTISHELRTPLNAIGGYVQLLEMGILGPVNEKQLESLGRVARSQQHLLRLINEILNFARIESGQVDYALSTFSLHEVVVAALPMIEPQLAEHGLTLRSTVPED
ncbi:MAG TPA: histidine kinase dimerization/phospho-acceptor domain-containing protein, partial [Gemmatimonadaceae bacterium]|nr:histidine kinase dimerization/phospho-acceptor domain-containing protein [Gemmatimonadaceae bacterium]